MKYQFYNELNRFINKKEKKVDAFQNRMINKLVFVGNNILPLFISLNLALCHIKLRSINSNN